MKLLVLSDLHLGLGPLDLEIEGRRIDAEADIVVLAGDINEGTAGLTWARVSFPDKPVVYVAGNHEFYEHEMSAGLAQMRETAATLGIHFLEKDEAMIDGVRFLGCTLWTDFALFGQARLAECMLLAKQEMNDYMLISTRVVRDERLEVAQGEGPPRFRMLQPADSLAAHLESRAWLAQQLASGSPDKTVVVTHHAPSRQSVPFYAEFDLRLASYVSDLSDLMGRSALWLHGHLHENTDHVVKGTRVVCNPRGYWNKRSEKADNPNFRANLTIEVEAVP